VEAPPPHLRQGPKALGTRQDDFAHQSPSGTKCCVFYTELERIIKLNPNRPGTAPINHHFPAGGLGGGRGPQRRLFFRGLPTEGNGCERRLTLPATEGIARAAGLVIGQPHPGDDPRTIAAPCAPDGISGSKAQTGMFEQMPEAMAAGA